jgi:hypothetical protein
MTTLLLSDAGRVTWRRARSRDRLLCRLDRHRLDERLAGGASPDASVALSLRARSLIGMRLRRDLARTLQRVLCDAQCADHRYHSVVPVCRAGVVRCRIMIEELAAQLTQPGPVDARGVAMLRLLLTNGASPLYSRFDDGGLDRSLRAALGALAVEDS